MESFFTEDFSFLFDNTSIAVLFLYLHLPSLNFCLLIIAVVVINFGLDCFTNSVLAYIHIPHVYCLFISLCW